MPSTSVKLHFVDIQGDGTHILIPVKVNGQKANMIIDTGASRTVFDLDSFNSLQADSEIQENEEESAGVGSAQLESFVSELNSLKIGRLDIQNHTVALMDLQVVKDVYSRFNLPDVIGVIGGELLKEYGAVIHYKLGRVRLHYEDVMQ